MIQPIYRILCVDDQDDANLLLERHLSSDYDCLTVSSASEALQVLASEGPFAAVISDYLMPEMNGVELFQQLKLRWPNTVRIMITADEHFEVALASVNDASVFRFVRKPLQGSDIKHAVAEAVRHYQQITSDKLLRDELAKTNSELDQRLHDLDEANELLEYWVEFSPAVLYSFSLEQETLRPSYISKNFTRLTGFERTTAVLEADFWSELVVAADRAGYQACLAELCRGELNHAVLEYDITHRCGDTVKIVDSLRPVHDGDGQTIEIVGAWMDVSARR